MKSVRLGLMLAWAIASSCGGKTDVSHRSADGGMAGSAGWMSVVCMHGDVPMRVGEAYNESDCVSCQCKASGNVVCSEIDCDPGCGDAYGAYLLGEVFPDPRSCGTCTCGMDGIVRCSPLPCPGSCSYAGATYPHGTSFVRLDGCGDCVCTDGIVACTMRVCSCDPQLEYYRKYLPIEVSHCAIVLVECPLGATPFTNEFGCGCEQDPSCPAHYDCSPIVTADGATGSTGGGGGTAGAQGGKSGTAVPSPYGSAPNSMGGVPNSSMAGFAGVGTAGDASMHTCPTPEQTAACPLSGATY